MYILVWIVAVFYQPDQIVAPPEAIYLPLTQLHAIRKMLYIT